MSKISFEKKLEHTKDILKKLQDPKITIEESLKLHKEGMDIVKAAQEQLDKAKLQYEEFSKDDT